jgi:hypothetical protein
MGNPAPQPAHLQLINVEKGWYKAGAPPYRDRASLNPGDSVELLYRGKGKRGDAALGHFVVRVQGETGGGCYKGTLTHDVNAYGADAYAGDFIDFCPTNVYEIRRGAGTDEALKIGIGVALVAGIGAAIYYYATK